ncbi:hypothetical protein [Buttiauxella izardii]|uniref:Lipoprotein n=1 Tax=Buttiauxella izardii TaxID=82991 RepID=A0A3A5JL14_9ENTR|nr:hypothetical protein [Buttiauxella izardii]RJT17802.1 hypothetical protein D6029_21590 [Buttiauxella izardii]
MRNLLKLSTIVLIPTLFAAGCVNKESTERSHHNSVTNQYEDAQLKDETARFLAVCEESGRQKKIAGWSESRLKEEQQKDLHRATAAASGDKVSAEISMAERARSCNQAELAAFKAS